MEMVLFLLCNISHKNQSLSQIFCPGLWVNTQNRDIFSQNQARIVKKSHQRFKNRYFVGQFIEISHNLYIKTIENMHQMIEKLKSSKNKDVFWKNFVKCIWRMISSFGGI